MENEELENKIQADIEKYNSLRESGANMSEAFTEATKSEEQIVNEKIDDLKDNLIERINDRNEDFDFEVQQFRADEGYGFGGGINDSAINEDLDKFIQEYKESTNVLEEQLNVISSLETTEDKAIFLETFNQEGLENAVDKFKTFSEEELQEALHDAMVDKLESEGYNFNDTDISNENSFNQELDKVADSIIENALDNNQIKEVGDEFKLDKDLSEWANEQAAQEFANGSLDKAIEEGYLDKYEISQSVQDIDNWTEAIKDFENSDTERVSLDRDGFEFGETLAAADNLDNDIRDTIMTREEGIEKALEAGVDIQELAEATSRGEVIEVAQESDRFEVINENQFINDIQDQVTETMKEEASDLGITVSNEIDFGNVNDGAYSAGINELENSSIEGVNILQNPEESGDSLIIVDSEKVNFEEVKEAIANEVIEANRESFESDLTNGKTFEEAAELGKSEIAVEGDHATVKEDTMAGEQTERVVDRETGLNEMDKAVGVDSDKVETKEESALRDGLSTEDQKILDSFDKSEKEITLNDAMESFNSKPQNAELSQENEGQKNAESAKQK